MLKRTYGKAVLTLASAGLLVGSMLLAAPQAMAEKITIAHAGGALLRLPFYVALQKKFFEAEGLEPEIVEARSGSDSIKMLVGGSVQFTTGQFIDAVNVQKQGVDAIGVAMLTQRMSNAIVVRKGLAGTIKTMKDLKGRPFGVTGIGSGTWQFAVYIARANGLKPGDLNFIGIGTGAGPIGAIKTSRVDALSYADPETYILVHDGDAVYLVDMGDDATHRRYVGASYLANQIMVMRDFAKKQPQTVQKFVNAIQRAINWSHAVSTDELAKVVHSFRGFARYNPEIFAGAIKKMMPNSLGKNAIVTQDAFDNAAKLSMAAGGMKEAIPMSKLVDNSFAEKAAKLYPAGKY
jgi:NitT/TauT family transport system substrate-binding protein